MEAVDTHFINCVVSRGDSFPFDEAQHIRLFSSPHRVCDVLSSGRSLSPPQDHKDFLPFLWKGV